MNEVVQETKYTGSEYQEIFLKEMSSQFSPEMLARVEKNNLYKNVFDTYVNSFPKDLFC
jgi:hypothetical protein